MTKYTADFLWEEKGIIPFLKVDKGLAEEAEGVQIINSMPDLDRLLKKAVEPSCFWNKNPFLSSKKQIKKGLKKLSISSFEVAMQIVKAGLMPIIEPEVDVYSEDKVESEELLKAENQITLGSIG